MTAWLLRRWYSPHPVWFLIPLAWIFWLLSGLRRVLLKPALLSAPVIVVGNITVGGTGKTPFVLWLADELKRRGHKPGIVTRGYRGDTTTARQVHSDGDPKQVGDEAVLLARRAGVPVVAGRDRVKAAELLRQSGQVDVILSDDGLQHYRLPRCHEIVLLDGSLGLGNGWLLPAGPLRESEARLDHVQVVIKQVPQGSFTWPGALRMDLNTDTVVSLQSGERRPLKSFAGQRVHALAAIGNPGQFFATLEAAGLKVDGRALPDHAALGAAELSFGGDLPVFMTEKDAVKCSDLGSPRYWYVEAIASIAPADAAVIMDKVEHALGSR